VKPLVVLGIAGEILIWLLRDDGHQEEESDDDGSVAVGSAIATPKRRATATEDSREVGSSPVRMI
jgi:hypothetical protein